MPRHGPDVGAAVDNVGRIVTDLRPSILDHQGLWAALEWQAQEFIDSAGLRSDLKVHVAAGVSTPPGVRGERWAIAVFRIFQEMLSDVARHAQASALQIRLYVDGPPQPVLYLKVRDDGVGAEPGALDDPRSYGVLGMRERAASPASYLNQPETVVAQVLSGKFADGLGNIRDVPDRAGFDPVPWQSMAVSMLTQMKRWGYIKGDVNYKQLAEQVFLLTDPKAQMRALGQKVPDGAYRKYMVMGKEFNPAQPEAYVDSFAIAKT